MAAPAVGAALKKVATYILTDKKALKVVGMIIGIVIVIIIMPIIAILSLFNGTIDIDTDRLHQMIQENQSGMAENWTEVETAMTNAGYDTTRIQEAQTLYVFALYDYADESGFATKLVGCFAVEQTDAELIANVNSAFGTNIVVEDFTNAMASTRNAYINTSNYTNYAQSLIDEFSDPDKMPQIVVSVDMMDTGIDVPEVVNLVFFKKVLSKSKFWQMIGRGTRLCPTLIDGQDKSIFYIFDFCGNFDFFRINCKGKEGFATQSVQERIFNLKAELVFRLQGIEYQTDDLIAFRLSLIDDLVAKIGELNRDNFAVRQHLRYIDQFSKREGYEALTYENTLQLAEEIAPLILPYEDDSSAVRFDALMYGLELAYTLGKTYSKARNDLAKKVYAVSRVATIPAVSAKSDLISKILNTDYVENAGINEFEHIRIELRDIMKYIPRGERPIYQTDFTDDVLSVERHESELDSDELQNYRNKVNFYIRQHMDNEVIAKLHTNKPLTSADIKALEGILWSELGTKEEYEKEYQDKPLGVLVREIVGLDMNSAKEAFAKYLNEVNLDDRQIYFVNQIINYIVKNGMLADFKVLQEAPFTDRGEVSDVFEDAVIWLDIMKIIKSINANAYAA